MSDYSFAELMDEIEWQDTPYILALGIQSNGKTDRNVRDSKSALSHNEQFYFIQNPTYEGHTSTEDSDDDVPDIMLCRSPPPFTVARVKELPRIILDCNNPFPQSVTEIELEALSCLPPEIVETGTKQENGKYIRVGLGYSDNTSIDTSS